MKKQKLLLALFLTSALTSTFAQTKDDIESGIYDAANNRYLFSQTGFNGKGGVVAMDATTKVLSWFYNDANKNYTGSVIVGNKLVVCKNFNTLVEFDLTTGAETSSFFNPSLLNGQGFNDFNDVAYDVTNNNLIISGADGVAIVNYSNHTNFNVLVGQSVNNGNGCFYDGTQPLFFHNNQTGDESIMTVSNGALGLISIQLASLTNYNMSDGFTGDNQGNYYVSTSEKNSPWGQKIVKFTNNFSTASPLASMYGADINYNTTHNVLIVPNLFDKVDLLPIKVPLSLPADGSTVSLPNSVSLEWINYGDIASSTGNLEFVYEISTNNTFTNIIKTGTTTSNITTVNGLSASTTYYWRVQPKINAVSFTGDWSEIKNFNTPMATNVTNLTNKNKVQIYPNPFNGTINVDYIGQASIKVFDVAGRMLLEKNNHINHTRLFIDQPKGVYFIEINDGEFTYTTQVVKTY